MADSVPELPLKKHGGGSKHRRPHTRAGAVAGAGAGAGGGDTSRSRLRPATGRTEASRYTELSYASRPRTSAARSISSVDTSHTALKARKDELLDELHDIARRLDFAMLRRGVANRNKPIAVPHATTKLEKNHNLLTQQRFLTVQRDTFNWASKEDRALNDVKHHRVASQHSKYAQQLAMNPDLRDVF